MKTERKQFFLIYVLMFFVLSILPAAAEVKGGTDYFPLTVGSWWKYKMELFNTEILIKVTGKEKIGGYDCYVVEVSKAGKVNSIAYYAKTGNKILMTGSMNMETKEPIIYKKPRIYLEYPLETGKTWKVEDDPLRGGKTITKKLENKETIKVPAGEFNCFHLTIKPEENDVISETWYAPGVGAVKMMIGRTKTKLQIPLVEYSVK